MAKRLGERGLAELPVWRENLQHHAAGCYSSHSGVKAWQRRAQAAVLSAERWAAIAGHDARADLERAWKQVLFNQFHDVLPGSAIEPAYDDARDQLGEAVAIAKRIITRAHNVIARDIHVPEETGTQPVVVFNPHPWPVRTRVEIQYGLAPTGVRVVDADGTDVPCQPIQPVATTDRFTYLLVPHAGDWRAAGLTRRAAVLSSPVRAMLESFHRGTLPAACGYLDDGGGQVMVTAVKRHEDAPRDLVVRAVETTGRAAVATLDLPLAGIRLTADFGPSQIRTFRIPLDDPLSVVETDLVELGTRKGAFTVEPW
ncbi:hypothetical protein ACTMTI_29805 [Nonomuraea sp. H19]|uniref:hypothetical protein n=1 Tax=Nonomuraea sp. H19 TaxID=3452206 RepID=UPI003F890581